MRAIVGDLLFELGTEELPARFVIPALEAIERIFTQQCLALHINHGRLRRFGTPRRLALHVRDVADKTPNITKTIQGPSVSVAFEGGGKPAVRFADSLQLPVELLKRIMTKKGEYLAADVEEEGQPVIDLMPQVLQACMRGIGFAKSMRWGDVERTFGRPLHWIVALLGRQIIPLTYADVTSGRVTQGHRFLAPEPIQIDEPEDYEMLLGKAHVLVDVAKRKEQLIERMDALAKAAGGQLIPDADLLEQVVNLVELPSPLLGSFAADHLNLPEEVLIQEMKTHQRYFSLVDGEGKLLPKFIAVSNTPVKDEAISIKGYQKVLQARLADGRFFFDEDCRTPLANRLVQLRARTWVAPLGNMAEKSERISALALALMEMVGRSELRDTIARAASLCKADLETSMVSEFPELQGAMGREYALASGESHAVARAIFEHYLPRGASDGLPTADAGALIGLADRLDTLCGLFGIGKKPTGARDDFALRRAAISFIRIVIGMGYRLSLSAGVDESLRLLAPKRSVVKQRSAVHLTKEEVLRFFKGRLESLLRESYRGDIVDAVLSVGFDDIIATEKRIIALSAYMTRPDFSTLACTFKRVVNIVEKQARDVFSAPVDEARLRDEAEKALYARVAAVRSSVQAAFQADDYLDVLAKVVPLYEPVNTFFNEVMVMVDDKYVRENRVRLLMDVGALFGQVADFSRLQA